MRRRTALRTIVLGLVVCATAGAGTALARSAGTRSAGIRCSAEGASTWTPPIRVSTIQPGSVSLAATLTCHGSAVKIGALAGFTHSPKLACVAPPETIPEAGVLTVFWNTGASSKLSVKVAAVNSTGHQALSGRVIAGLFKGDPASIDLQAKPGVGHCTDASPLVSNTWTASVTL